MLASTCVSRSKKSGFTMVELMAVAVILAILSGLIGMMLYDAKAEAKKATCAFNLRQTGIGVVAYIQDYDGMFCQTKGYSTQQPQIDDASGAVESPDRGSPLKHLGAFTTGLEACPADPDPDGFQYCPSAAQVMSSYLVNGYFVWGIGEYQLESDSQTVYVAERRSNPVGTSPANCDVIFRPWYNPNNPLAPQNDMDADTGAIATTRHRGNISNYLFADDHCSFLKFTSVWDPPTRDWFTPTSMH